MKMTNKINMEINIRLMVISNLSGGPNENPFIVIEPNPWWKNILIKYNWLRYLSAQHTNPNKVW